jgi:dihydrofolate reductase
MLTNTSRWSHARGNEVVPSRWQATPGRGLNRQHQNRTPLRRHRRRELKAVASSDLTVGGADLAAQAFKAGLVDECQLFVWPMAIGGGKPALPTDERADFELLDERRFANGVVHLRYRPRAL